MEFIGGYFWFNVLLLNDIIDLIGDINDIIFLIYFDKGCIE